MALRDSSSPVPLSPSDEPFPGEGLSPRSQTSAAAHVIEAIPSPCTPGGEPASAPEPSFESQVQAAIGQLLSELPLSTPLGEFRAAVANHLGLGPEGLENKAELVTEMARSAVAQRASSGTPAERMAAILVELGEEAPARKSTLYMGTISRVLPDTLQATDLRDITGMTREEVGECVRQAFDNPLESNWGGPKRARTEGIVRRILVFREAHADGDVHFHVVVVLHSARAWGPAKRALRERDRIASHWSSTHTQQWSAVRYNVIPTVRKPAVDDKPYIWPPSDKDINLFELSQKPWNAALWKHRREETVKRQAASSNKGTRERFSKLDLTAIIIEKGLRTTASIITYAQDFGTVAMQTWVHNQQKHLSAFLCEAKEWETARDVARAERESDWSLLCRTADSQCPHNSKGCCAYGVAAARFFDANASSLSRVELAVALRAIIIGGPSKTTRTPLIVGPTNTGKSTLVLPFDTLFGNKRVFHKPALGSKFALRNILKDKRFLFWDDYRPVEYAQKTIDVATFLSLFTGHPFEVQVSQSFNDGNEDFEWRHGAVMTAKEEGLWRPRGDVTDEEVRHMQSRVSVFRCYATLPKLKDTHACACCMAAWIRDSAAQYDASSVLAQPQPPSVGMRAAAPPQGRLLGMAELAQRAALPDSLVVAVEAEILSLGAVHVQELAPADWMRLQQWPRMGVFVQRRILSCIS